MENKKLFQAFLLIICIIPFVNTYSAVPLPPAIYSGKIDVGGQLSIGVLEVKRPSDRNGESLVISSALISKNTDQSTYILQLPVVHLLPDEVSPPDNAVQVGDSVDVYLNGINMGKRLFIGDHGTITNLDLSFPGFIHEFSGTASGGTVSLRINGTALTITTTSGQSTEIVVSAIVSSIKANPALSNIAATAQGRILTTTGEVTQLQIDDSGLK
ncbi:MAG: hypothetical protein R3B95_14295 [Nitrospirales bacterium]|nr:hypothetical protein [Nitrospirales bacterium]